MSETELYQGMSKAVMAKLLAYIAALDPRQEVGVAQVEAWHPIAVEYHWTYPEAEVQARKFFANNTTGGFLDVGKLNGMIRAARQDRMSREAAPTTAPTAASRVGIVDAWVAAKDASKRESANRRTLVLKHEDLRAALTKRPLEFPRPEDWSGWIPPELTAAGARNTSPRRLALLALVAEAAGREAS